MKGRGYSLLALTLWLASCANVQPAPPQVEGALCPRLPDLDPPTEDAQELISIETMQNFLRGSLPLRFESSLSGTSVTPSTDGRKTRSTD